MAIMRIRSTRVRFLYLVLVFGEHRATLFPPMLLERLIVFF